MQKLRIVEEHEMEKVDNRNTKKHYLMTDSICSGCGCINNTYYNEECQICKECKGEIFVTGKIGVELRLLLDYKMIELRELCEINGINESYRIKMVLEFLKLLNSKEQKKNGKGIFDFDKRVNENLIRVLIKRRQKKNWYKKEIETAFGKGKPMDKLSKIEILEDDDNLVSFQKV